MIPALFALTLSLLLVHELDAIRAKEWRMFVVLQDLPETRAYQIFALAHLPLLWVVLWVLSRGSTTAVTVLHYVVDILLVGHTVLHFGFRNHPNNGFTSVFSQVIIYALGLAAMAHLLGISLVR